MFTNLGWYVFVFAMTASAVALASAEGREQPDCGAPRMLTMSKIETTAKLVADSLKNDEANPLYRQPEYADAMKYARWQVQYFELLRDVARGNNGEEIEARAQGLVRAAPKADLEQSRQLLQLFAYIHRLAPTDVGVPIDDFGRYLEQLSANLQKRPLEVSALDRVEMARYQTVYGELLGELEPIRHAIESLEQTRSSQELDSVTLAYIQLMLGVGWFDVGTMSGTATDLEKARDYLSAALEVFGVDCDHVTGAEAAMMLARTYFELSTPRKDSPTSPDVPSLAFAEQSIELAQRLSDPLQAPAQWKLVYSLSSDIYKAEAQALRNVPGAETRYSYLADWALNLSL